MGKKRTPKPTGAPDKKARDDFHPDDVVLLAKRAAYICSNPRCRAHTIAPSKSEPTKCEYSGVAAHITAAAAGGPRYDPDITSDKRSSTDNGIFLCTVCATVIDKNKGVDYSVPHLLEWKELHEEWVRANLNKAVYSEEDIKKSVLTQVSEVRDTVLVIGQRQTLWLPLINVSLRIDLARPVQAAKLGDYRVLLALFDPAVRGGQQVRVAARAPTGSELQLRRCFWLSDPASAHGVTEALQEPVSRIAIDVEMYRRGPVDALVCLSRHRGVFLAGPAVIENFAGFEVSANGQRLFGAATGGCVFRKVPRAAGPSEPKYFDEGDTYLGHPPIQPAPVDWPAHLLGDVDAYDWSFIAPDGATYNVSRGEYYVEDVLPKPVLPLTMWNVDMT